MLPTHAWQQKLSSLLACLRCSTEVFLTTHRFFTGIFGRPRLIYTDHAPSLIKAAGSHDWAEIAQAVGKLGTEWCLTAKGCSWRNGQAERVIHAARHTLSHVLTQGCLVDFHQLSSILSTTAAILNSRPLTVRTTPDGDFSAISPQDILLGRAGRSAKQLDDKVESVIKHEEDENLLEVDDEQARIVDAWRHKWLAQAFVDMVPRSKWKLSSRNLQVGDIGHVRYENKYGPDAWRIASVVKTELGEDGLVRTVEVAFRPRHVSDWGKPYRSKEAVSLEIGVQRCAVLLPVEEQHQPHDLKEQCPANITHTELGDDSAGDLEAAKVEVVDPQLTEMLLN